MALCGPTGVSRVKSASPVVRGALVAAVGPLVLASRSLGEYWIGDLAILLTATTCVAAGVTLGRRVLLTRIDEDRGAALDLVVVAILTLPFLLAQELRAVLPADWAPRQRTVLMVTAAVGLSALARLTSSARPPRRALSIISIAAGFVCVSAAWRIAAAEWRERAALATSPLAGKLRAWDADSAAREFDPARRPDIFLFVLDAYAGDSLLRADYGIDHQAFESALGRLGFAPQGRYTSNYARTFASMASILNFAQVAAVDSEPIGSVQHAGFLQSLITDSRAARLFGAAGYDIHWVPAPFFGGRALPPRAATVHRVPGGPWPSVWIYSVLIHEWVESVSTPGVVLAGLGVRMDVSVAQEAALAQLLALASDRRPTFAVVHLFSTHEPLVRDASCGVVGDAPAEIGPRAAYAAAVSCLDAALLRTFQSLVRVAGDDIVIAAIGDHAPSSLGGEEGDLAAESVPLAVAGARFDAGAYFYVPPAMRSEFVAPASGVEIVPALVRAAFAARLPSAPSTRYYSRARPHRIHHFVALPP